MVGSVVGLGDRHSENILLDSTMGECMHVDFNCMFWKGLEFKCPEQVPFRLTPNVVDGLGCMGYNGMFREVCTVTMRVLRENKEMIVSVLETLVHDPLAEWMKTRTGNLSASSTNRHVESKRSDAGADNARGVIRKVTGVLDGQAESVLPQSVEMQVSSLIQTATDPSNLGRMFIGWAAYM